ncbi:MAG: HAMP domain-containing protein [Burkholderiales bacterium]|nr:HAMP domain-containing protein [Burkholderiales bacterium]
MKAPALGGWPRSLFARVMVILLVGMALAQGLSFGLVVFERSQAADRLMLGNLELDVASSVSLLDMLPADKRTNWLGRLGRRNYSYLLNTGVAGTPPSAPLAQEAIATIARAAGERRYIGASAMGGPGGPFQVHLRLSDGSPLTIDIHPAPSGVSPWLPALLCIQFLLLLACTWAAVRLVTRPLKQLAAAAEKLGPDLKADTVPEQGPTEVVHAAAAFNAMQQRISGYLTERVQILAAISHDLQTPITRMRLRLDLLESSDAHAKLYDDLSAMEQLVREGLAYARTLHGGAETPVRVDLDTLLDSLVCDYHDAGQAVSLEGKVGLPITTRPQALRRILSNLVDNALKFGTEVGIHVQRDTDTRLTIAVCDRGPGIPEEELERVLEPFYRLESSRNRGTGGTGLGLAIAAQLAQALGGSLVLSNRAGGGLQAMITLPI